MNYIKIYDDLINRAKNRITTGYTETHHIIPKCINGTDDKLNLVILTPEEHYIAHLLLVKIYPNCYPLIHAAVMMTVKGKGHIRTNKLYGWLRRKHALSISNSQKGSGNSQFGRYWIYNTFTKEIKRINSTEIPNGWIRGKTSNAFCEICGIDTGTKQRRFCKEHKPKPVTKLPGMVKGSNAAKKLSEYCKARTKEQHPQYGRRWINDGTNNKMVLKDKVDYFISIGWIKGKCRRS